MPVKCVWVCVCVHSHCAQVYVYPWKRGESRGERKPSAASDNVLPCCVVGKPFQYNTVVPLLHLPCPNAVLCVTLHLPDSCHGDRYYTIELAVESWRGGRSTYG